MERIPWPTTHADLTPDDIPYGYSAFNSTFDDGRGYQPVVVGYERDEDYRLVILVALSPGNHLAVTVVDAGQTPEEAGRAVLAAVAAIAPVPTAVPDGAASGPSGSPVQGQQSREADQ